MLTADALVHPLDDVRAAITAFTMQSHKMALFEGGIARGVTLAPVNTVADVLAWSTSPSATTGTTSGCRADGRCAAPGRSSRRRDAGRLDPSGARRRRAHPRGARRAGRTGRRRARRRPVRPSASALPLEGVKVADFSWIGVGPITAKALADHGATVVHVEHDSPADRLRLVGPFKDDIPGINRCQFFGSFNTSKLSLQLDLKHPDRQRRRPPAAGVVRHRPRLVHRRHDGRARPRLRRRPRAEPGHHHGHDVPDGPGRPGRRAGRVRLPRRRGERLLRDHRLGRPPAGRAVQRLHRHRGAPRS